MSATAFYIPKSSTSSSSADIIALQSQVTALKTDVNGATDVNSSSTIVKRDPTGGFAASTVKLNAIESNGATLDIAAQNGTSTVNLGKGSGVQTINVGNNGTGKTTIKLGGGTDEVQVNLPLKNASGSDVLNVTSSSCFVGSIGNPSGVGNTFVGTGISTTAGKFGTYNTGMGNLTLAALDTGSEYNVAIGSQALAGVTTGRFNVAVGSRAGWDPLPEKCQISGTGCTFIGTDSKPNSVIPLINATAIGSQAVVDASNTIQLGHVGLVAVKTNGTLYAAGLESIGTTLTIAGQNNTSVVDIGKGTGVQTINVGNNGTGATVINLGGAGDTVNISGTLNNVTTTNTQVADKSLVLNSGGTAATAGTAGIYFEEAGVSSNSYVRVSPGRSKMELKAPTGTNISLNQSLLTTDDALFNSVTASNNVTAKAIMGIGLAGGTFVAPTSQGAGIAWNRNTLGRTCFTNQQGGGLGGWEWLNYSNSNVASANPQMTLDVAGNLSVIGGLRLPTTGGTASTLNHYKEYTFTTNFGGCASYPGVNVKLVRVGKLVTMSVTSYTNFLASSTGYFVSLTAIPSQFRPSFEQHQRIGIYQTAPGDEESTGVASMTSGIISVGTDKYFGFAAGAYGGFAPFGMSWVI